MGPGDDFERFYRQTHDRLVTSLAVLVGDLHRAADATDEAFERAFTRWDRVRQMESPAGWTYRVALNAAKRQGRVRALDPRWLARRGADDQLPVSVVEIRVLLASLPQRQREAMTLRVLGDLTETEIGTVLGVTRTTVQSALADARRKLVTATEDERSNDGSTASPR